MLIQYPIKNSLSTKIENNELKPYQKKHNSHSHSQNNSNISASSLAIDQNLGCGYQNNNTKKLKLNNAKKQTIIKIQVNKLLKNNDHQNNFNNKQKVIILNKQKKHLNVSDHSSSIQKLQNNKNNNNNKNKSFQELYFQKIKQLKLNKQYPELINININQPLSCKKLNNSNNLNNFKHLKINIFPNSTKNINNYSKEDKQNQKPYFLNKIKKNQQFQLKKEKQKIKNCVLLEQYQKNNKTKKVILSKGVFRNTNNNKINQDTKIKQFKSHNKKQSDHPQSYFNFKLYPNNNKNPHLIIKKQFYLDLNQIIESNINHSQHQHIWGGRQCFFSQNQFNRISNKVFQVQGNFLVKYIKICQNFKKVKIMNKVWLDLAGQKYGGIVKDNMINFLAIILGGQEERVQNDYKQQRVEQKLTQINSKLNEQYINDSTLKLRKMSKFQKNQIKKSYLNLFISAQSSSIVNNLFQIFNQKPYPYINQTFSQEEDKLQYNQHNYKLNNQILANKIYLDSDNHRQKQLMTSPLLNQQNQNYQDKRVISDFSPKLSSQQYEPFGSMILQKDKKSPSYQDQVSLFSQSNPTNNNKDNNKQNSLLKPLLSVDVNLGQGVSQKLIVYQGQTPYQVSLKLKEKYNIDQDLRLRFERMLQVHMRNLLFKIQQVSEQIFDEDYQNRYSSNNSNDKVKQKQEIQTNQQL